MALSVTTNIPSLYAQNALDNTTSALDTSLQRLSTGLRINTGADGPAAYVISQQQQAQIAGLQTAISNTSQATDLVQTADGALGTISNLLVQIRGLALDSANSGVQDAPALQANQAQINNALQTIDNIAANTQFGTKPILNGSAGYGATSNDTVSFTGLGATSATVPGTYTVNTTGSTDTGAAQGAVAIDPTTNGNLSTTANLAQNETLTITGPNGTATVALTSGATIAEVEQAINAATGQTGVVASTGAANGLQLQAQSFGQNFSVTSNVAAATAGSTGIGTAGVNTASTTTGGIYTVTAGSSSGEQNAQKGALSVIVGTTVANTAFVSNSTNLANATVLTINGPDGLATVALAAGLTNTQVAQQINNYTSQTGVVADTGATGGGLRLYTQQFGQNFQVSESNTATAYGNGSLGIGSSTVSTGSGNNSVANPANANFVITTGQNAVVKLTDANGNSVIVTGDGANITATTGSEAGLTFTLTPSNANPLVTTSVAGSNIAVANGTLTFQIGPNAGQTASLSIGSVAASNIGIVSGNMFANLQAINVTTTAGAQATIAVVDQAINDISTISGTLGAFQTNTLQATASNLQATLTNTQSAESTIADTDYSSEIANFTQLQVQEQAGVSVLGLANQIPQNVLTLLQKL
jgi:flagellin